MSNKAEASHRGVLRRGKGGIIAFPPMPEALEWRLIRHGSRPRRRERSTHADCPYILHRRQGASSTDNPNRTPRPAAINRS